MGKSALKDGKKRITMRDQKDSELKPLKTMPARIKAQYVSPKLRTYGSVNLLTAGRGSSVADRRSKRTSDRSVKHNIVRIGSHPAGFGLYLFDYKPEFRETAGYGRQFGVMADEVETVLPQAVVMHPDGYKRVDYALLGIDLAEECAQ
jgi:hypothetical protein